MSRFLAALAFGVGLAVVGYLLLYPSRVDGPAATAVGTVLMFGTGPACGLAGFLLFILRRPTPHELSAATAECATWHIRPVALLGLLGWAAIAIGMAAWDGSGLPDYGYGDSFLPRVFMLEALPLIFLPLGLRRVRELFFYPLHPHNGRRSST
jgi:hypothetical protein